jgi:pimeloyl-ACP methyl ester carboxylesterase
MKDVSLLLILAVLATLGGCNDEGTGSTTAALACDTEPEVMTTSAGVDFVRTPDACFEDLPDWPYAPQYVDIDGLRQAYVDEGPAEGEVVLLLHGQPSWSYLYRKMIPSLTDAGYRVIAMDHVGMGRSDKPTSIESYSYLNHSDRLQRFIEDLDLRDINLFVQDWGAGIGLRVAGLEPERYARIAVGNGQLPVVPEGVELVPPVENPDEVADIPSPYASIPPQQELFYDGCRRIDDGDNFTSFDWALKGESFHPAHVVEALTWFDLPEAEEAAYDAPYPSREYMAGTRVFASLRSDFPGLNQDAWANLTAFERPFLTIWAGNDPKETGSCELQNQLICSVAGAQGQAHVRLSQASHFLQDDQGEAIAERLIAFFRDESGTPEYVADCEAGTPALPVAEDGTGTPCTTDADCADLVANTCLTDGTTEGFCTVEMCEPSTCGAFYVCCGDCNPAAAAQLPFEGSACLPEATAAQLEGGAGCTCD